MRNYEVTILNYEGALKVSGGLNTNNNPLPDLKLKFNLPDHSTDTVSICAGSSGKLIGMFEVGQTAIALILNQGKAYYSANVEKIGDSQVFPTIPPIEFTRVE